MRRLLHIFTSRRRTVVVVGLALLATTVGALAYWAASGSGTATGSVGTLAAPTGVAASASGEGVSVSWNGVTAPGGGAIDGYYVQRYSGATATPACGSSPTNLLAAGATSCSDTGNPSGSGVPAGTYTYKVTAVWRSWTARSAASNTVEVAPLSVSSTSPSSRGQGASKQVIAIKGANFVSGATASFGAGITVESTSFVSSTELEATITVAAGASTGARTVTVTNPDASSGSLAKGFTVNAGPSVSSTSPSSRGQGASKQVIAIKGANFVSGATASFGAGITVESTSFTSSTELKATITVESGASTGARTVTVTNPDAGSGSLANGFTVNAGPSVSSTSPSSGDRGGTQNVTVKGANFVSGATASLGTGVKVNSTTFKTSTELTANITVESGASTGARTVTVTNPDAGSGSLAEGFTVNGAPTVTSTSPSSADRGGTLDVAVKGTNFESGATTSFGSGVKVNSTTFKTSTELTANITIESEASTGTRTVTVTNPDTTSASLSSGFTVNGKPSVSSTSPSSRGQGASNQEITVKGSNLESGASVSFSGSGITVNSTTFKNSSELTANITIDSGASTGSRTVTVTNPDTTSASLSSGFTVNSGPSVESTSPSSRAQGMSKQVITIKGKNFVSGATASFGAGITVESTSFTSSTELKATITVESGAATGARTVTVTNPDAGTGSLASGFTVTAGPHITSISPSTGDRGGTENVTITGTGFQSGASVSFSGSRIKVNSTTFEGATQLKVNITIESEANIEARTVTVTNPDGGSDSLANGFTVNGKPTVTSASPSSADRGGTENVTVTGTNFESGATVSLGSGVTVNSTTFESATQLKANITVEAGASTGTRTVTVTNPDTTSASLSSGFTVNGAPTVTSTSPSSRGQGTSNQEITVKGSNLESGASVSFSGTGITVNSTTFKNSSELTANITIASEATTGSRTVTVTNPDTTTASLASGFTVNASPTVTSTSPSSRGQGASKQTISVKGANFVSGATASFGTGITVESTSFVSSTELNATITVEAGAATGARTVTVTNPDAGTSSLANGFTVNVRPTVSATSPSSGDRGGTENVTVTGTNFVSGATASFGSGVTVNSTTFEGATQLKVSITIESGASTGSRTVTVTNPDAGTSSLSSAFTVNGAPTVTSTSPSSGDQGGTENVAVKGSNFESGASVSFGTGVTVNSTTFVSAGELKANITIAANASTGSRTVTVTNPDTTSASLSSGFTVNGAPTLTSTSPSARVQGASNQEIAVKGTNFESGASVSFSGTGLTVNSTTFTSSTELKANITIAANAPAGGRTVTVTNPDTTTASLENGFTVNPPPNIESLSPSSGDRGGTENVTITGTEFQSGASVSFGSGVKVNSTTFEGATQLKVSITIESEASTGTRTVTVTNPDTGVDSLANAFTVNGKPSVSSTSPSSGDQGGTENVAVKGSNFESGASVSFGTGVTVNSTTFVSAGELKANITIAANASTGSRTVTVTNPDTTSASLSSGFTVNGAPTLTSTSPSARVQGASNQSIAVKGTNFESGASVSFSGTGITLNSTTFTSSTELKANITIAADAPAGGRTVTVTNPDTTTASLENGFTVNPPPNLESLNPSSRGQGASSQAITVNGADFQSGASVSFSGTGIKVNSTTFVSSTELVTNVTVESGAAIGSRTVTVTNPDAGTSSLANGFTVNVGPAVTSTSPSSGDQGGTEDVTVKGSNFVNGASVSFGTGITVNSTTFVSASELKANIAIASNAGTGSRTVSVTNPDAGTSSLSSGFTVNGAPTVTSISPNSGDQGGTETVAIKGTNFENGATVSFGSSITVNSTTFTSSTELKANITIGFTFAGARTVTVTNPDTTSAALENGFTVNGPPTVTSTSPSSRGQGAASQEVAIKGTNFESGASVSFSGTGITLNSTIFVNAGELMANITIASNAAVGGRTVTVTNPDTTSAALENAFTVNAGPTITSPTKANPVNPGHNGETTFTMTGSSFVSGLTVTGNGAAEVLSFKWESSTAIKVTVKGKGGLAEAGSFTVTNPDSGTATSEEGSFRNG